VGSRGKRARARVVVVHPVLFAAFPVIYLWARNLNNGTTFHDAALPLLVVVGSAGALFGLAILLLRDARKAGVIVSLLVLAFFSYGYVSTALQSWTVGSIHLGRSAVLLPVALLLTAGGIVLTMRAGPRLPGLTRGLNFVAAGLVLVNVATIALYQFRSNASGEQFLRAGDLRLPHRVVASPPPRPDIYYIILEEYAGEATLRDQFGYDNSPFLNFLSDRGFYVAHHSTANYPRTELSVASSLNMKYLDFLSSEMGPNSGDFTPLVHMVQDPQVARLLKSLGYRYIHVGSWWGPTASSPVADVNVKYGGPSEFSTALYETTALAPLAEDDFRHREWKRVQFQFKALADIGKFKGPRFVFAHILTPHEPMIFDHAGRYVSFEHVQAQGKAHAYVEQLRYANSQVMKLVDRLLLAPERDRPVIIIQSDEGPYAGEPTDWTRQSSDKLQRKFGVLNAYFLPGAPETGLYQTITPVNSFRLVFNLYFDGDLPLLPDRDYVFRTLHHLYDFTDVTDQVPT
jgi:sulfatase-like protein